MIKKRISSRGLKLKWVAAQIGVNYNSLRVYLADEKLMPEQVRNALNALLK